MKRRTGLAAALLVLLGTSEFSGMEQAVARGGAASIMGSPGYQRRLQESRKQLSRPHLELRTAYRGKRHHRRGRSR